MFKLRSVGAKLFILFFVSTFVSVLLVGMVSYRKSQEIIENKVESVSRSTVKEATEKIGLMLKQFEDMSLQFSTSRDLQERLLQVFDASADPADQMEAKMTIQDTLNQIARTNANIKSIALLNARNESESISSVSTGITKVDRESEWYKKVTGMKGSALWLPVAENGYTGLAKGNLFALSRMIGSFLILFEIDSAQLNPTLEAIRFSDHSRMILTDASGKILLSSQAEDAGGSFLGKNGEDGLLVVSEPLKKTEWTLSGIAPRSELVSETRTIRDLTIAMCAAAAVLAIAVGFAMLVYIGKPLLRIRGLLNEAAEGNLDARLMFKRSDEIGEVAASFDTMMERMKRLIEQTRTSADRVMGTASGLLQVSRTTETSSGEISAATEQIAQGSLQLAAEADQANRIVESMKTDLASVVGSTDEIGVSSSEVKDACAEGNAFMRDAVRVSMESEASIDTLVRRISSLEVSTGEMRKIFDMMNGITKDSKILSLNAGIEATRVGQGSGGGFKVIASEMGRLSDQTQSSLSRIGDMTETIRNEISKAVEALKLALPLLQTQIRSVKTADDLFAKVYEKSEAFLDRAERIKRDVARLETKQSELSGSISSVSSFSQQASASSEQVAALSTGQLGSSRKVVEVAKELEGLSTDLQGTLADFRAKAKTG